MEHKSSWRWCRRPSETTVVENASDSLYLKSNAEEDQEKAGPRKCSSNIGDRSSAMISECSAKDELIRKHASIAEQALAGQRAAIAEAKYFKQELDKALQQGEGAEQKLAYLNAALKDCMQEIEALQVGQKVTVDFEKEKKKLEGKVAEANKRVKGCGESSCDSLLSAPIKAHMFGILSACLSALAGIYTEFLMKKNNDSLYWQNVQLYTEDRVNKSFPGLFWSTGKDEGELLRKSQAEVPVALNENDELDGGFSSLYGMLQWEIGRDDKFELGSELVKMESIYL